MAFDFLRRRSLLTHGFIGWWWASRHAYPADEHGVRAPVYGWVDAEAPPAAETANRPAPQASLPAPETAGAPTTGLAVPLPPVDDRIAAFPARA